MKPVLAVPALVAILAGGAWAQAQITMELKSLGNRPWSLVLDEHPAPGTCRTVPLAGGPVSVSPLSETPRGTHTVPAGQRQVFEWAGIPDGDWGQVFTLVDADGNDPGVGLRVVLGEEDGKPALKTSLVVSQAAKGIDPVLLECVVFATPMGFVIAAEDYRELLPAGETRTPASSAEERKGIPASLPSGPGDGVPAVPWTPVRTPSAFPATRFLQTPPPTAGAGDAARACAFGRPLEADLATPSRLAPLDSFSPDARPGAPAAVPLPPGPHTPRPGVFKVRETLGGIWNDTENDHWELTPWDVPEPMVYYTRSAWGRFRTGILAQGSAGPTLGPGENLNYLVSSQTQLSASCLLSRASERDEHGQVLREARMQLYKPFSPDRVRPVLPPGPVHFEAQGNAPGTLPASGGADYQLVGTAPGYTVIRSVGAGAPLNLDAQFAAVSQPILPAASPAGDEPAPPLTEDW